MQYERVWSAVFQTKLWADSAAAASASIVLIGADIDLFEGVGPMQTQACLLLTAFDRTGDLQYEEDLLSSSLRGPYNSFREAVSNDVRLTVGRFDIPEILGGDFSYLFSPEHPRLQTKYCYYNDPQKKIRTVGAEDIRGIGGVISRMEDLQPIFLLNLHPPHCWKPEHSQTLYDHDEPEQFIFRSFGGPSFYTGISPLVDVMYGKKLANGENMFDGFTFINAQHESYNRKEQDWMKLAEQESDEDCTTISTL